MLKAKITLFNYLRINQLIDVGQTPYHVIEKLMIHIVDAIYSYVLTQMKIKQFVTYLLPVIMVKHQFPTSCKGIYRIIHS